MPSDPCHLAFVNREGKVELAAEILCAVPLKGRATGRTRPTLVRTPKRYHVSRHTLPK